MPGNSFGTLFKVTTWGESHGKAMGAVVDGCPSGILLSEKDIQHELDRRKPDIKRKTSTSRKEKDKVEILSGVFKGKTTGMPISMIIWNKDVRAKDYSALKDVFRPGHADFTYEMKYGIRDYRGGGRASGRETVGRVMAGAIANKILLKKNVKIIGKSIQIGPRKSSQSIEKIKKEGDSVGGIIEIRVKNALLGLGEPVFDKLDADLSKALFSIGGVKAVSFGAGFDVAEMKGSECNDEFIYKKGMIRTKTNNAGGIQGGISNGEDIIIHIAVKPTPSISKKQKTVDIKGKKINLEIKGRHDVCIVPRLIPVAESMVAITLVDHLLRDKAIS